MTTLGKLITTAVFVLSMGGAVLWWHLHKPDPRQAPLFSAHPVDAATLYPLVDLEVISDGKWGRPRAKVVGTVEDVHHESDGDWHFKIGAGGKFIVCEICPELPMTHPKVGDKVAVYGIVREDKHHGFWEIHPVMRWEKSP